VAEDWQPNDPSGAAHLPQDPFCDPEPGKERSLRGPWPPACEISSKVASSVSVPLPSSMNAFAQASPDLSQRDPQPASPYDVDESSSCDPNRRQPQGSQPPRLGASQETQSRAKLSSSDAAAFSWQERECRPNALRSCSARMSLGLLRSKGPTSSSVVVSARFVPVLVRLGSFLVGQRHLGRTEWPQLLSSLALRASVDTLALRTWCAGSCPK
jgi:hypothetical protein